MKGATFHAVAAEQPKSTINGTPACSGYSGTSIALNESLVSGEEEPVCVYRSDHINQVLFKAHLIHDPQHLHCDLYSE